MECTHSQQLFEKFIFRSQQQKNCSFAKWKTGRWTAISNKNSPIQSFELRMHKVPPFHPKSSLPSDISNEIKLHWAISSNRQPKTVMPILSASKKFKKQKIRANGQTFRVSNSITHSEWCVWGREKFRSKIPLELTDSHCTLHNWIFGHSCARALCVVLCIPQRRQILLVRVAVFVHHTHQPDSTSEPDTHTHQTQIRKYFMHEWFE